MKMINYSFIFSFTIIIIIYTLFYIDTYQSNLLICKDKSYLNTNRNQNFENRDTPKCLKEWIKIRPRIDKNIVKIERELNLFKSNSSLKCSLLPNTVRLKTKDLHFPHFMSMFFSYISLSLFAYEILGNEYNKCGISLENLILDEENNYLFNQNSFLFDYFSKTKIYNNEHKLVEEIVLSVNTKWQTQVIVPKLCMNSDKFVTIKGIENFQGLWFFHPSDAGLFLFLINVYVSH
jgi:hypothetical protein